MDENQTACEDRHFVVDLSGFEGPLDLLLSLARDQKVDLARISILELSEQYLSFIESARKLRLEIAADYLVMAAWLAYLKSRLLLPEKQEEDEPSGEEMAQVLAFKLERLEAIRDAARRMMAGPRLQIDLFPHGMPEGLKSEKTQDYRDTLYDLLKAYGEQRSRGEHQTYHIERRAVFSLQDANEILERLFGVTAGWVDLTTYLIEYAVAPEDRRSMMASCFASTLEYVREGLADVRQDKVFAPIMVRPRRESDTKPTGNGTDAS
ncbi:MAG: segregation/condensation protein A [Hyphomicrobiales bacterium]|nr:segregation/condensation protein A [Hyphomicrobiales bacterium]